MEQPAREWNRRSAPWRPAALSAARWGRSWVNCAVRCAGLVSGQDVRAGLDHVIGIVDWRCARSPPPRALNASSDPTRLALKARPGSSGWKFRPGIQAGYSGQSFWSNILGGRARPVRPERVRRDLSPRARSGVDHLGRSQQGVEDRAQTKNNLSAQVLAKTSCR